MAPKEGKKCPIYKHFVSYTIFDNLFLKNGADIGRCYQSCPTGYARDPDSVKIDVLVAGDGSSGFVKAVTGRMNRRSNGVRGKVELTRVDYYLRRPLEGSAIIKASR